ncbi:antitoxin YefM [Allofrancisella inopinata]|uniref:Antitoxin n=1 Tax=Allofrancisella inopinata TaxID=1085647 RepID=A0AAE6YJ49_9GAMM|nr:type II toxin-antitoxin system prevent-host-death family antitoxin [Allofrancisella inopinata]QIV96668.1 type II toxin-antitoxin system prevent-host-death family antitoxin [Allofrancisella inopinata]TDT66676.1 antitoxin YefM [Allofrancisella inopinata]
MRTLNYTSFRNELASSMDSVIEDHQPIVVTRGSEKKAVVVMSLDDFKSYQETAHLMSSINNYNRLDQSIKELESGNSIQKELIEE